MSITQLIKISQQVNGKLLTTHDKCKGKNGKTIMSEKIFTNFQHEAVKDRSDETNSLLYENYIRKVDAI